MNDNEFIRELGDRIAGLTITQAIKLVEYLNEHPPHSGFAVRVEIGPMPPGLGSVVKITAEDVMESTADLTRLSPTPQVDDCHYFGIPEPVHYTPEGWNKT